MRTFFNIKHGPKKIIQVGLKFWANMLVDPLKVDVFNPPSLMSHPTLMLIFWATFLHVFGSNKWFGLEVYIIGLLVPHKTKKK